MTIDALQTRLARVESEMQAIRAELLALTQQKPSKQNLSLEELGISQEEALALRHQFGAMAADWDSPEMDIYDDIVIENMVFLPA